MCQLPEAWQGLPQHRSVSPPPAPGSGGSRLQSCIWKHLESTLCGPYTQVHPGTGQEVK